MREVSTIILVVAILGMLGLGWWAISGIHLGYLKANYQQKLSQYDFRNCIYDGYKRSIFDGFGGQVYVTCSQDGIYYTVMFARRINSPELQMYGPFQMTTFPNQFNINQ